MSENQHTETRSSSMNEPARGRKAKHLMLSYRVDELEELVKKQQEQIHELSGLIKAMAAGSPEFAIERIERIVCRDNGIALNTLHGDQSSNHEELICVVITLAYMLFNLQHDFLFPKYSMHEISKYYNMQTHHGFVHVKMYMNEINYNTDENIIRKGYLINTLTSVIERHYLTCIGGQSPRDVADELFKFMENNYRGDKLRYS